MSTRSRSIVIILLSVPGKSHERHNARIRGNEEKRRSQKPVWNHQFYICLSSWFDFVEAADWQNGCCCGGSWCQQKRRTDARRSLRNGFFQLECNGTRNWICKNISFCVMVRDCNQTRIGSFSTPDCSHATIDAVDSRCWFVFATAFIHRSPFLLLFIYTRTGFFLFIWFSTGIARETIALLSQRHKKMIWLCFMGYNNQQAKNHHHTYQSHMR